MERHFHHSLDDLRVLILNMASAVQKSIDLATRSLQTRSSDLISDIFVLEEEVNRDHILVDEICVKLLALQQPVGVDLRLIVAILKINSDLERMGDQAVNIAMNTRDYIHLPEYNISALDLPKMFNEVKLLVQDALDTFVAQDPDGARKVLLKDDLIDEMKDHVFEETKKMMKLNSMQVEPGLCLILIARNLERIADHATNIAEDVIFAVNGDDVRHGNSPKPLLE